jgi:hypothetical protein
MTGNKNPAALKKHLGLGGIDWISKGTASKPVCACSYRWLEARTTKCG